MRVYSDYLDPTSDYTLTARQSLYLFHVFMARHQFYLQNNPNIPEASRGLLLFAEGQYPKTLAQMRASFGFGFDDWTAFCTAVYSGLLHCTPVIIEERYLLEAEGAIVPKTLVPTMFGLLSASVEEVGNDYLQSRNEDGVLLHDPGLPSFFIERPLLQLAPGRYVAPHTVLVFYRGFEGIYDLCRERWQGVVGAEFGLAFERYVAKVLEHLGGVRLITEREMRAHTGAKICDYLIVGPDYLLFMECKAVKYGKRLSSEGAIKGDTSTRAVARGIDQLYSASELVQRGALAGLLGNASGKAFLAAVVTYGRIYAVNDEDYWREMVLPLVKANAAEQWEQRFTFRPQVLGVDDLEKMVLLVGSGEATPLTLYREKSARPYIETGDWDPFLSNRGVELLPFPIWRGAFEQFFEGLLERLRPPGYEKIL